MRQYTKGPDGRLVVTEATNGGTRSQVGITWFAIGGETRKTLLAFCMEDGLDLVGTGDRSTSMLEGRAINAHVEVAVSEYIASETARRDAEKALTLEAASIVEEATSIVEAPNSEGPTATTVAEELTVGRKNKR